MVVIKTIAVSGIAANRSCASIMRTEGSGVQRMRGASLSKLKPDKNMTSIVVKMPTRAGLVGKEENAPLQILHCQPEGKYMSNVHAR
jgi:hypothetical protein